MRPPRRRQQRAPPAVAAAAAAAETAAAAVIAGPGTARGRPPAPSRPSPVHHTPLLLSRRKPPGRAAVAAPSSGGEQSSVGHGVPVSDVCLSAYVCVCHCPCARVSVCERLVVCACERSFHPAGHSVCRVLASYGNSLHDRNWNKRDKNKETVDGTALWQCHNRHLQVFYFNFSTLFFFLVLQPPHFSTIAWISYTSPDDPQSSEGRFIKFRIV